MQRERAERLAVVGVAAHELARQVLGLRRAATVADCEQPSAGREDRCEVLTPQLEAMDVGEQTLHRARGGGHVVTCVAAEPRSRHPTLRARDAVPLTASA